MTNEYILYSGAGFIGFSYVFKNHLDTQGGITLFDTVNNMMYQKASQFGVYDRNITDLEVIRDLMQKAIPSFSTNQMSYFASDKKGVIHTL